jgi:hypothetical protein
MIVNIYTFLSSLAYESNFESTMRRVISLMISMRVSVSVAAPDQVLGWSYGEVVPNQRQLITALKNQSVMVSSVKRFSDLQRTGNVIVVSTKRFATRTLFVTNVA